MFVCGTKELNVKNDVFSDIRFPQKKSHPHTLLTTCPLWCFSSSIFSPSLCKAFHVQRFWCLNDLTYLSLTTHVMLLCALSKKTIWRAADELKFVRSS